jgi:hypothetical protein
VIRLGQTEGLKVLGRSATRAYRGRAPSELARELNAAVVLTGTVRPNGDSVKISLELVDPSDNTALWTGQYTREVRNIFAVQAQVADDVASALRVRLRASPARERAASRLVDPRAYETYLRGRQAAAERNLDAAKQRFEKRFGWTMALPRRTPDWRRRCGSNRHFSARSTIRRGVR